MCFGCFGPTAVGYKIAGLDKGTEIIILEGEGYPQTQKEKVDIIWVVAGYSALTAGGIILGCEYNSDIILTGRHFDVFPVSDEAKRIQKEVDEIFGESQEDEDKPENPISRFMGLGLPKYPSDPE